MFPPIEKALEDPNGLLAVGGDLSIETLLNAYSHGIFPWFNEGDPIQWWSPAPRAVINPQDIRLPQSCKKTLKKYDLFISVNQDFKSVIHSCATTPRYTNHLEMTDRLTESAQNTWITNDMLDAYIALHQAGWAHSFEVWQNETLVGGLYGIGIGSLFCGESMFHTLTNTSKIAFYFMGQQLAEKGVDLVDCQIPNPHLTSLGVKEINRSEFKHYLPSTNGNYEPLNLLKQKASAKILLCQH